MLGKRIRRKIYLRANLKIAIFQWEGVLTFLYNWITRASIEQMAVGNTIINFCTRTMQGVNYSWIIWSIFSPKNEMLCLWNMFVYRDFLTKIHLSMNVFICACIYESTELVLVMTKNRRSTEEIQLHDVKLRLII